MLYVLIRATARANNTPAAKYQNHNGCARQPKHQPWENGLLIGGTFAETRIERRQVDGVSTLELYVGYDVLDGTAAYPKVLIGHGGAQHAADRMCGHDTSVIACRACDD